MSEECACSQASGPLSSTGHQSQPSASATPRPSLRSPIVLGGAGARDSDSEGGGSDDELFGGSAGGLEKPRDDRTCFKCGQKGHLSHDCPGGDGFGGGRGSGRGGGRGGRGQTQLQFGNLKLANPAGGRGGGGGRGAESGGRGGRGGGRADGGAFLSSLSLSLFAVAPRARAVCIDPAVVCERERVDWVGAHGSWKRRCLFNPPPAATCPADAIPVGSLPVSAVEPYYIHVGSTAHGEF